MCSTNAGGCGSALIFAIAARSVAVTSVFAGLLKPMWLSLICTKRSRAAVPCDIIEPCDCPSGDPFRIAAGHRPHRAGAYPCHALQEVPSSWIFVSSVSLTRTLAISAICTGRLAGRAIYSQGIKQRRDGSLEELMAVAGVRRDGPAPPGRSLQLCAVAHQKRRGGRGRSPGRLRAGHALLLVAA